MAWASIIAALIGAGASKAQADSASKGLKNASAEQKNALMTALSGTAEYQGIGKQGALSLGELMGLEGYRTKSDIALREHLANKPGAAGQLGWKDNADFGTKLIEGHPAKEFLSDSQFEALGGLGIPGGASLTTVFNRKSKSNKKKAAAAAAAQNAAAAAKYQTDLAAWEAKKADLERQRDVELQTYDPTAALRATPGYDYRYKTGLATATGALNRTNMSQSGRALKELTNYGQDFASNEYGNEFNRRLQLMTGGQSLAGQTGGWNLNTGGSLASIAAGQGNAQADYYGNLNRVAQGSLANYTYGQNREKDRRSSSYNFDDGGDSW